MRMELVEASNREESEGAYEGNIIQSGRKG